MYTNHLNQNLDKTKVFSIGKNSTGQTLNLNYLNANGFYYVGGNSGNNPTGTTGVVIVFGYSTDSTKRIGQLFLGLDTNALYARTAIGDVWSSWSEK